MQIRMIGEKTKEFTLLNPVVKFSLKEMQELHQQEYPNVMFEYYMDNKCHSILENTEGLKKVQVIVSDTFKYEYRKQNLEVVR